MKWYWAVECDNTVEDPVVIDSGELIGMDRSALMKGERVASWDPPTLRVFKVVHDGAAPDDVLQNHLGLPIFSSRLRKAIEAAGINDPFLDLNQSLSASCQDVASSRPDAGRSRAARSQSVWPPT